MRYFYFEKGKKTEIRSASPTCHLWTKLINIYTEITQDGLAHWVDLTLLNFEIVPFDCSKNLINVIGSACIGS